VRILTISDTHAPYQHPGALDFLADLKRKHKPELVVCLGDLGDQHGWSRHERLPDALGQADEHDATLAFCRALYKIFPRALACVGNHDTRLAKRCVRAGIPSRLHRTVREVYDSPQEWVWADNHLADGIAFMHGEGYSSKDAALKAAKDNRMSTCIGHIHSAAGVQYTAGAFLHDLGHVGRMSGRPDVLRSGVREDKRRQARARHRADPGRHSHVRAAEGVTMPRYFRVPRPASPRRERAVSTSCSYWRRIRATQLRREPLCSCGRIAREVDHISADTADNRPSNLRSYCKSCHSRKTVASDGGFGRAPVGRAEGQGG
jgi:predicted phosphodiesterase/5-methylcytosine-specific restriction endonuclease McrA